MPTALAPAGRGDPHRLLVAVLFVVLAGVLGMHGWGSHGVAGAGHTTSGHHSGVTAEPEHRGVTIALTVGDGRATAAPAPTGSRHSSGMGLTDLCVAVLSGLGFVVLLLLRSRRPLAAALMPTLRPWHSPTLRGRDRDPPSLARLSVLRR